MCNKRLCLEDSHQALSLPPPSLEWKSQDGMGEGGRGPYHIGQAGAKRPIVKLWGCKGRPVFVP